MLFTSAQYLFFYIGILILSWLLAPTPKLRLWTILLSSFYFYWSNNGWIIMLLFVCMQIDFVAARMIEGTTSPVKRKLLLFLSMGTNLSMLAFFKYFNFFCGTISDGMTMLGMHHSWNAWNIILPVGISFYTFESMSYTIDVYRGEIKAEKAWSRFALFVAYFPHLIAGPILRPHQFLPQMDSKPKLSAEQLENALFMIAQGLIKKVICADFLANYADKAFNTPAGIDPFTAWLGVFAFTFQIYYDFSGYTDVAIGCARLMGFELPINFNRPYASASITEFWRRWHISLSSWLRDYLYIPLGGSRMKTEAGVLRNLMITMLLGGLWHGAAWHFVLWGFLQGAFLVVERIFKLETNADKPKCDWLSLLARQAGTFALVTFSWMVFRIENMKLFGQLVQSMFSWNAPINLTNGTCVAVAVILLGWALQLFDRDKFQKAFISLPIPVKGFAYAGLSVAILACTSEVAKPFIYFQF